MSAANAFAEVVADLVGMDATPQKAFDRLKQQLGRNPTRQQVKDVLWRVRAAQAALSVGGGVAGAVVTGSNAKPGSSQDASAAFSFLAGLVGAGLALWAGAEDEQAVDNFFAQSGL